jgi:hypothetical protein
MMLAAPLAGIVALVGAASMWKRAPVFVLVAALQIPVTVIALSLVSMRVWPRFFFTEFAFACVFLAEGAFVLGACFAPWVRRAGLKQATANVLFAIAASGMLAVSAVLAVRNYTMPKQDFPGPIALLASEGADSASVGVLGWGYVAYLDYFETGWRRIILPTDLDALRPSNGAALPERTSREQADVWSLLERDFTVAQYFPGSLGDGGIVVFKSKTQPAETTSR